MLLHGAWIVGLLNTSSVFTQEFIDGLKAIPAKFMSATVKISRRDAQPQWDPETGTYTTPSDTVLYEGPARVTPRRAALQQPIRENPTVIQNVQFQIPIDGYDFDLRTNCLVTVTNAPLNPTLTKYAYRVHEIVDSSNPIEYTFWCVVDEEVING